MKLGAERNKGSWGNWGPICKSLLAASVTRSVLSRDLECVDFKRALQVLHVCSCIMYVLEG